LLDVGVGIGAGGGADVAALPVGDHQEARGPGIRACFFERAHPVGAEGFEEGELQLHTDDVRRDRVHESAAEARARFGGGASADVRFSA
jgi:hypothetical protein